MKILNLLSLQDTTRHLYLYVYIPLNRKYWE